MMVIGMLWQDRSEKTTLVEKIKIAVEYYRNKYSRTPEICVVNKSMLSDGTEPSSLQKTLIGEGIMIEIRSAEAWPPTGQMWIGVDQMLQPGPEPVNK